MSWYIFLILYQFYSNSKYTKIIEKSSKQSGSYLAFFLASFIIIPAASSIEY